MKIYARVLEISLNVDKNRYSLWNSFSYIFFEISTYKYFNFKVLLIELKSSSFRWILMHVYEISKRMVRACLVSITSIFSNKFERHFRILSKISKWIFIYFYFSIQLQKWKHFSYTFHSIFTKNVKMNFRTLLFEYWVYKLDI